VPGSGAGRHWAAPAPPNFQNDALRWDRMFRYRQTHPREGSPCCALSICGRAWPGCTHLRKLGPAVAGTSKLLPSARTGQAIVGEIDSAQRLEANNLTGACDRAAMHVERRKQARRPLRSSALKIARSRSGLAASGAASGDLPSRIIGTFNALKRLSQASAFDRFQGRRGGSAKCRGVRFRCHDREGKAFAARPSMERGAGRARSPRGGNRWGCRRLGRPLTAT
jgi:hypothetical protein